MAREEDRSRGEGERREAERAGQCVSFCLLLCLLSVSFLSPPILFPVSLLSPLCLLLCLLSASSLSLFCLLFASLLSLSCLFVCLLSLMSPFCLFAVSGLSPLYLSHCLSIALSLVSCLFICGVCSTCLLSVSSDPSACLLLSPFVSVSLHFLPSPLSVAAAVAAAAASADAVAAVAASAAVSFSVSAAGAAAELDSPQGGLQRRKSKGDSSRSSSSSSSSSVMEIDEEDAAIINETKKMGYCYFRRDLTEEEKKLNAQNKPTKILSPSVSPQAPGGAAGDSEKVRLRTHSLGCIDS